MTPQHCCEGWGDPGGFAFFPGKPGVNSRPNPEVTKEDRGVLMAVVDRIHRKSLCCLPFSSVRPFPAQHPKEKPSPQLFPMSGGENEGTEQSWQEAPLNQARSGSSRSWAVLSSHSKNPNDCSISSLYIPWGRRGDDPGWERWAAGTAWSSPRYQATLPRSSLLAPRSPPSSSICTGTERGGLAQG